MVAVCFGLGVLCCFFFVFCGVFVFVFIVLLFCEFLFVRLVGLGLCCFWVSWL